jgi:hypothetical protein
MNTLLQEMSKKGLIENRNIDVAVEYKGVPVTGYVQVYAGGDMSACMSTKSVFALMDFFGGSTPDDDFSAACNLMIEAAESAIANEVAILNLTQHAATAEQVEAGVVEPAEKSAVQAALTFDAIPTAPEMAERAELIARIAVDSGCKKAMIGGAPFFMAPLERALLAAGITPVYAFSVRDSVEQPDGNGGVRKVNVFRHIGFVEAAQ